MFQKVIFKYWHVPIWWLYNRVSECDGVAVEHSHMLLSLTSPCTFCKDIATSVQFASACDVKTQGFIPALLVPPSEDINLPWVTSPQHELFLLIITFICTSFAKKAERRQPLAWTTRRNRSAAPRAGDEGGEFCGTAWSKSRSMWLMTIKWKCSVAEMFQIVTLPRGCWLRDRVAGADAWPTASSPWTWLLCLLCRTGAFYVHYAEQGLRVCITASAAATTTVVVVVALDFPPLTTRLSTCWKLFKVSFLPFELSWFYSVSH